MSIKKFITMASVVFGFSMMLAFAADDKPFKATCPVSGQPAVQDKTAAYKNGTVYFCCNDCAAEFGKNTAKYSTKANLQLASTGQAVQTKCPLSGGKLNPEGWILLQQLQG
jgi:YHS domain-containing protein